MSNPVTALCAAYIAYKAHNVEPFATIGKMCVMYKVFKFFNNLCYDWGIDRGTDLGSNRLLKQVVLFCIKSAQSRTTNPDGSITYTYRLGSSKTPTLKDDFQMDFLAKVPFSANWTKQETLTKVDSTPTKTRTALITAAAIATTALSIFYLTSTTPRPVASYSFP
jgi:hypothetical protein